MGMYTAVAINLKFMCDPPPEVITLVKKYVECDGLDGATNSLFCGYSHDFKEWEVREFTEQDGQWVLRVRASTKSPEEQTIRMFLTIMEPFVDIAPDTVVLRTLYVEGSIETVYYYCSDGRIIKESGWHYRDVWDSDHPRQTVDFEPPPDIYELRKAVKQKKLEDDERGGYGF